MSVEDQKRVTSSSLLDEVHGNDTEAFLDDLVKDEFSDWCLSDCKKDAAKKMKHETDDRKLTETLLSTKNVGNGSVLDASKAVKENKSVPAKTTSPQPQRKWTRFPKRLLTASEDKPLEKDISKSVEADDADFHLDHIKDTANRLERIHMQRDDWEDESSAKFRIRHKKMESCLENLLHDGTKRHENMDQERIRRSSSSSQESTTTSCSSNSQDQSDDTKYFSACTEEELIACKMKDVHEKFNDNICDNWVDDVELALMVMKRQSKGRDLKSGEIKNLLSNILEQK